MFDCSNGLKCDILTMLYGNVGFDAVDVPRKQCRIGLQTSSHPRFSNLTARIVRQVCGVFTRTRLFDSISINRADCARRRLKWLRVHKKFVLFRLAA